MKISQILETPLLSLDDREGLIASIQRRAGIVQCSLAGSRESGLLDVVAFESRLALPGSSLS